ncbi:MAG: hypothetical protein RSC30_07545 [Oscillospiraceae bacterium]
MGDYSTLYPLVDKIKVKVTARILIDTDTTLGTWIEQTGTILQGSVQSQTSDSRKRRTNNHKGNKRLQSTHQDQNGKQLTPDGKAVQLTRKTMSNA